MYELIPLHHAEEYFERSFQLLNHQWPRLASVRMGMLRLSRDSLPTSLVLVEDHKVIGHIKIKQLFSRCRALWIESVVIDKALRGKGYGKILMLETEKYARKMGFELAYLATYDQQGFYSRLGYEECEKVCVFDKPIGDEWVPDTSFLKEMSWNVTHSKKNGFSKLSISNCNGTNHQNSNNTLHKSKKNRHNSKKHFSRNGYHRKNNHNNILEGTLVQIDENGWHEIDVKTMNGNCPASSAVPEPPPPPPPPVRPLQYLNGIPVPPAPPPPPPKAPSAIPPYKKIPAVALTPIKKGVAVPAPPPKNDSEANNFLLISSLLSNDGEGIKTFMKKSLI
ncbi:GNAT domain [Trinorchestia longiramus]|nr:GNAT domain [Trinorchestia longiramus]